MGSLILEIVESPEFGTILDVITCHRFTAELDFET